MFFFLFVYNRQTDTGRQQIPRLHIASRGKHLCFLKFITGFMALLSINFAYCSWRTNEKGDKRKWKDSRGRGMGQGGKGKGKDEGEEL